MGKFAIALAIISGGIAALSEPPLEGRQTWKGTIRSEAGITIVENPAKPICEENILDLLPEFVIPGNDKNGQYTLFRIGDVSVDDQGQIYILDIRDFSVKVFDDHGRYLRNIGRSGMGPGELDGVFEIEVANDSLFALNTSGFRVHMFHFDGRYQKSIVIPERLSQLQVDRSGNFYGSQFSGAPGFSDAIFMIVRYDRNFKIKKEYASRRWEEPRFYGTNLACVLANNGDFIVGNPSKYEIFVHDQHGVKKIIKKKHIPVKIPNAEIKRLKDMNSINWEIPNYFDAYDKFYADDNGRIIVNTHSIAGQKKAFYDVFDNDGKFLSSFVLDIFRKILWKNGLLYAADEDKDGLPVVRVFKVQWKK